MKVYVIEEEDTWRVKIGVSEVPFRRLAFLQTVTDKRLHLRHEYEAESREQAFRIEREAHRLLDEHRLEGEWFSVSVADAIAAINEATAAPPRSKASGSRLQMVTLRLSAEEIELLRKATQTHGTQRAAVVAGLRVLASGGGIPNEVLVRLLRERID